MLSAAGAVLGFVFAAHGGDAASRRSPQCRCRASSHVAIDARVLPSPRRRGGDGRALRARAGVARRRPRACSRRSRSIRAPASAARSRARAVLVVADLVLALILLAGAGLMLRTDGIADTNQSRLHRANGSSRCSSRWSARRMRKIRPSSRSRTERSKVSVRCPASRALRSRTQVPFGGDYDCRGFHAQGTDEAEHGRRSLHRALRRHA